MTITPAQLLTKQFWINLGTLAFGAFATAFLGSLSANSGVPSVHSVETAAWAAAAAAIAVVLHSFGVTAQVKASAPSAPAQTRPVIQSPPTV